MLCIMVGKVIRRDLHPTNSSAARSTRELLKAADIARTARDIAPPRLVLALTRRWRLGCAGYRLSRAPLAGSNYR
jgi:hypothetical protein